MRILSLITIAVAAVQLQAQPAADPIRADLMFLASDACEGRGLRTKGLDNAADYIAATFQRAGLKPINKDGTYFQALTVKETYLVEGAQAVEIVSAEGKTQSLALGKDYQVSGLSGKGTIGGSIVVAGYGITAPHQYDDYDGIDVKNKVVVILRQNPRAKSKEKPLFTEEQAQKYAPLQAKVDEARRRGAAAVVFVNDRDRAGKDDRLLPFEYIRGSGAPSAMPVIHVKRAVVDAILRGSNITLAQIEAAVDFDLRPRSMEFPKVQLKAKINVASRDLPVKNVVGYLDGNGPLAEESVVIGAHYDHLGRGEPGARLEGSAEIHYGADDNASGTSGLLELARRYGADKNRSGRRIIFTAFTGEERGLLGSAYYVSHPSFPLDKTVAMFNMDMIGRVRPDDSTKKDLLQVGGVGSAKSFEKLLDESNAKFNFKLEKVKSGTGPSDHTSFYIAKVPVYFFFSGLHNEYHTPADRIDTINFSGVRKVVDLVDVMVQKVAADKERPEYVPGVGGKGSPGAGDGPKLGLMPHYDDAEVKGMQVGGVMPGRAAEKAGLKKGDRITAIGTMPVKNVQDYMAAMKNLKRGEPVEITVERDGKTVKLKATPE